MADATETKSQTGRRVWARVGWIALGAALAALFQSTGAVVVNNIADASSKTSQVAPSPAPTCATIQTSTPQEGHDSVGVLVRTASEGCWGSTLAGLRPGDKFQIGVSYQNLHREQQDNVVLHLTLPTGFQYVAGSSYIADSTTKGKYKPTIDGITSTGVNVGSYQWKGNVYYKFTVVMTQDVGRLCDVDAWAFPASAITSASSTPVLGSAGAITVNEACN